MDGPDFGVRRQEGVEVVGGLALSDFPDRRPIGPDAGEAGQRPGLVELEPDVSLFHIRRQHIFDPFHECADAARQIAPMCYDEGHGERPATKIGYDLDKRSTL
jgi:hypothetical protein